MRVALVHDYLTHFGGAERVLEVLMELFPHAPVFTLVYDKNNVPLVIDERRIRTSFLQKFPGARRSHRYFPLALMPFAVEQFDFSDFDVVLSSTHSFSKGIVTGPDTLHISYCFTPIRYAWDDSHRYVREFSRNTLFQKFAPAAISYIRMWDYCAAARVDSYVTLSRYVARRIEKYYKKESHIISPPVDVERFAPRDSHDDYYLVVSRLVPYKRVDIAIDACNALGRRLKVVGTGPEMKDLQERAGSTVEFLGFVSDRDLPELYAGARALLFPQEEDFGITPLEAAASGKPTIAYAAGGAMETIKDDTTGIFFHDQRADSLVDAMRRFEEMSWDAQDIYAHALTYGKERFLGEMGGIVKREWDSYIQYRL